MVFIWKLTMSLLFSKFSLFKTSLQMVESFQILYCMTLYLKRCQISLGSVLDITECHHKIFPKLQFPAYSCSHKDKYLPLSFPSWIPQFEFGKTQIREKQSCPQLCGQQLLKQNVVYEYDRIIKTFFPRKIWQVYTKIYHSIPITNFRSNWKIDCLITFGNNYDLHNLLCFSAFLL